MSSTAELRRAAVAVYLAAESGPAEDISNKLKWAADEIDRLTGYVKRFELQISASLKARGLLLMADTEGNYSISPDLRPVER